MNSCKNALKFESKDFNEILEESFGKFREI